MENLNHLSKNNEQRILRETRVMVQHESQQHLRIMRKNYQDGSITIEHRVQKVKPLSFGGRG